MRQPHSSSHPLCGECLTDYFEHFPLLEIDYSFYRPLLESHRNPRQNFHVFRNYRQYMKDGDLVLLKAPQIVIARKLKRGRVIEKSKKGRNRIQIFTKSLSLNFFILLEPGIQVVPQTIS